MDNLKIAGIAYEQAEMSLSAAHIANDIQKLIECLSMWSASTEELKKLQDAQQLCKELHYRYSFSSVCKNYNL